jgi:enoyl-CoA hydratase/carnithine racemase
MEELLLQARDERGVVALTLNRPHAFNALSEAMLGALAEACDALAKDESVRAVVLGASGTAFCAGHDLKEMRAEPSLEYCQRLFAQCSAVMLVTGDFIAAEEACAKGLVNRVVAPEALDDEVGELVARIVAKPRVAVAMGKALFYRQLEEGIASAYADAGATMACNMMDPSALEGVRAFIEKRPPSWSPDDVRTRPRAGS